MNKLSIEMSASARNNVSMILQALDSNNQSDIAKQIGIDASTVTRMKTDKKSNNLTEIEILSFLLSLVGLKVVKERDVYCSLEVAEATRVYLANAFNSPEYMRILFK